MNNLEFLKSKSAELGLDLSDQQLDQLLSYAELLEKWNKTYNLIGRSTVGDICSRHIVDSLQLVKYFKDANSILDFGAGAGIPSIVLAIVLGCEVTACERIGKKVQFVQFVKRKLVLTNLKVVNVDVKEIKDKYDYITCRAVASLHDILVLTNHVKSKAQKYVLPKGEGYKDEILELQNNKIDIDFEVDQSIVSENSVILTFEY
jgi:16S rRNA (guanine527-N7)-methyltransferase